MSSYLTYLDLGEIPRVYTREDFLQVELHFFVLGGQTTSLLGPLQPSLYPPIRVSGPAPHPALLLIVWSPNCRAVSIYCPGNSAFQEFSPWRFLSASCKPRKTVQTMMFVFVWGHLRISSPLQCWQGLGEGGEGDDRGWDGWMASLTRWTWIWVNSGSWWWTGRPGILRFMGSPRVGHDWATELNWQCWQQN